MIRGGHRGTRIMISCGHRGQGRGSRADTQGKNSDQGWAQGNKEWDLGQAQ